MRISSLTAFVALSLCLASSSLSAVRAEDKTSKASKPAVKGSSPAKSTPEKGAKDKSTLQKLSAKQTNPAHFDTALMLQTQNIINMAIPEYRDALKADPKFVSTYNNLAQCLWDRNDGKDREEARELLKKALEIEPKNVGTMHVMALIKEGDKDISGAEALYRRILTVQPINFRAVQNLSELMFRQGKKEEAKKVINTALANSPPESDISIYKQALANLEKSGKPKVAAPAESEKKGDTKTSTENKKQNDG